MFNKFKCNECENIFLTDNILVNYCVSCGEKDVNEVSLNAEDKEFILSCAESVSFEKENNLY